MPRSALRDFVRKLTAGVGKGPSKFTSQPIEIKPAVRAFSTIYPDLLVSLPIITLGKFIPFPIT